MYPQSVKRQRWVLQALEQYEARLLRFAARLLHDEDSARDAVQHRPRTVNNCPPMVRWVKTRTVIARSSSI